MIGLIRLAVFGLIGLTVIYVLVSIYSRSLQREELEKEWDANQGPGDRTEFIETGMKDYENGLRRKLIWLVYILPTLAMLVAMYLLNFA